MRNTYTHYICWHGLCSTRRRCRHTASQHALAEGGWRFPAALCEKDGARKLHLAWLRTARKTHQVRDSMRTGIQAPRRSCTSAREHIEANSMRRVGNCVGTTKLVVTLTLETACRHRRSNRNRRTTVRRRSHANACPTLPMEGVGICLLCLNIGTQGAYR
jgi:hypothetical protein